MMTKALHLNYFSIFVMLPILFFGLSGCHNPSQPDQKNVDGKALSGNPIFDGWYADPEAVVLGDEFWIFPTWSAPYHEQVFLDAFSSKDLVHWQKHAHILDTSIIRWAKQAMWAPALVQKDGRYYLFFSANDVQIPGGPYWDSTNTINHYGGIGVAVADSPDGVYSDYLHRPLIDGFYNDSQPIDQFVFKDKDDTYFMYYGGWGHCNIGKLNAEFTGFVPWEDGNLFHEITPEGYVEGAYVFIRHGIYYFMWSEGSWGDDTYKVAYAMADSPSGSFNKVGTILQSDPDIAAGAGHNSMINVPGTDDWNIVYHRRPIPSLGRDHRVTCLDRLYFNPDGTIRPVKMTVEGVPPIAVR
jgi:beta-xylosidase